MEIGEFFFDFPVWIIGVKVENKPGFAICKVDGQDCLSIFTDKGLIDSYLETGTTPGEISTLEIESAEKLAALLEGCLDKDFATHIAIDPVPTAFVWPITEAVPILRRANE